MQLQSRGEEVEEIEFDVSEGRSAYQVLRGLEMVGQCNDELDRLEQLGNNLRKNVEYGLNLTTLEIARAERARADIYRKFR